MFQIFKSVLLLSGVGSALTLILLLIKPLVGKHFSSAWRYYIWLVVLVVMILPIRLPKRAVEVDLSDITDSVVTEGTAYVTPEQLPFIETGTGEPVTMAEIEKGSVKLNVYDIISLIWLAGAVVFMLSALASYWRFLLRKRRSSERIETYEEFLQVKDKLGIKRRITIRKSEDIDAPMLAGVFKPVIYVPKTDIKSEELSMIFMHELTHYKRRDLWYKWFSLAVNAIHWFNPFMHIAVREINEACEMSCDISVTKNMTEEERKLYMNTIVGLIKKGDKKNV